MFSKDNKKNKNRNIKTYKKKNNNDRETKLKKLFFH